MRPLSVPSMHRYWYGDQQLEFVHARHWQTSSDATLLVRWVTSGYCMVSSPYSEPLFLDTGQYHDSFMLATIAHVSTLLRGVCPR